MTRIKIWHKKKSFNSLKRKRLANRLPGTFQIPLGPMQPEVNITMASKRNWNSTRLQTITSHALIAADEATARMPHPRSRKLTALRTVCYVTIATDLTYWHSTPCTCPRRQKPPPRPTQLPFPATEANRPHLQQWLLDYYSTSTFNTCDHQPLPLMGGVPMRLMVNPTADQSPTTTLFPYHFTGKQT